MPFARLLDKLKGGDKKSGSGSRRLSKRFSIQEDHDSGEKIVDPSGGGGSKKYQPPPPQPQPAPSDPADVASFAGFDSWLSTFTPAPLPGPVPPVPPRPREKDEVYSELVADEVNVIEGHDMDPREQVTLRISGLRRKDSGRTGVVSIRTSRYISFEGLREVLRRQGYQDCLGLYSESLGKSIKPTTPKAEPWPIGVTSGPSSYSPEAGLLINENETVGAFLSKTLVRVKCTDSHLSINDGELQIGFHRTLRIPEDGQTHDLPADFGLLPLHNLAPYVPKLRSMNNPSLIDMANKGGVFFPLYQREAMWISFTSRRAFAVRVFVGGVNAVSGLPWNARAKHQLYNLQQKKQDYVVVPPQKWLDGISTGTGVVKQFIAMPIGSGYSIEKQVTGKEDLGGLQLEITPSGPELVFLPSPQRGDSLGGPTLPLDKSPKQCGIPTGRDVYLRAKASGIPVPIGATATPTRSSLIRELYLVQPLAFERSHTLPITALYNFTLYIHIYTFTHDGTQRPTSQVSVTCDPWTTPEELLEQNRGRLGSWLILHLDPNGQGLEEDVPLVEQRVRDNAHLHAKELVYDLGGGEYSQGITYGADDGGYGGGPQEMSIQQQQSYASPPRQSYASPPPPQRQGGAPPPQLGYTSSPPRMYQQGYDMSPPRWQTASAASPPTNAAPPTSAAPSYYSAPPPPQTAQTSASLAYQLQNKPQMSAAPNYYPKSSMSPPPQQAAPPRMATNANPSYASPPNMTPLAQPAPRLQRQQAPSRMPTNASQSYASPNMAPPQQSAPPQAIPPPRDEQLGWTMGVAAGGLLRQGILPDPHSPSVWLKLGTVLLSAQILNSVAFEGVTGMVAPPTPITPEEYVRAGFAFYRSYEEGALAGGEGFGSIKSVGQLDVAKGPVGVSAHVARGGRVGCSVCQRRFIDCVLRPCNHAFCVQCVKERMVMQAYPGQGQAGWVRCGICGVRAERLLGFAAPMGLPGEEGMVKWELRDAPVVVLKGWGKGEGGFVSVAELEGDGPPPPQPPKPWKGVYEME